MAALYSYGLEEDYTITQGLQGSNVCDEALHIAREVARDKQHCVLLEDDDGDWIVTPDGKCTRAPAQEDCRDDETKLP